MPKQAEDLQAAIEALPALYAAFSRGDLETGLAAFDPDVEYIIPHDFPEGDTYRGHAGVRRFWEMGLRELDYWRVEPERFITAPPNRVLVFATERIKGRASKVETETHTAHLWTFRDGMVVRGEIFFDRTQALEAAGLSE